MRRWNAVAATASLALLAASSVAAKAAPATAGPVRASDPAGVAAALQRLGYRAVLSKDHEGDPKITTGMSGLDVALLFYGCHDHADCTSLQFGVSLDTHGQFPPARAAEWNNKRRWLTAGVDAVNDPDARYDLDTGKSGLSEEVFGSVVAHVDDAVGALKAFAWSK